MFYTIREYYILNTTTLRMLRIQDPQSSFTRTHVLKDQKRIPRMPNARTMVRIVPECKSQEKDFYYERFVYRLKATYNTSLLEISSRSKTCSYDPLLL